MSCMAWHGFWWALEARDMAWNGMGRVCCLVGCGSGWKEKSGLYDWDGWYDMDMHDIATWWCSAKLN